jgi:hypothetical protein
VKSRDAADRTPAVAGDGLQCRVVTMKICEPHAVWIARTALSTISTSALASQVVHRGLSRGTLCRCHECIVLVEII